MTAVKRIITKQKDHKISIDKLIGYFFFQAGDFWFSLRITTALSE